MTEQRISTVSRRRSRRSPGYPASDVTRGANLAEDFGIDSLMMIEIVAAAEDRFNVEIPDVDLGHLRAVQDVISHARRMQDSGVPA